MQLRSKEYTIFRSWEVNFDMMDIEPTLERSREIRGFGPALLKSPEGLLGYGEP